VDQGPIGRATDADYIEDAVNGLTAVRGDPMRGLFSSVSFFRRRAVALFHRADQLKADSAERQARWNEVIAEHQKPLELKGSEKTQQPRS
jgi:hypothetical protein